MNIAVKTIPHAEQRYPTCGDWWFTESGDLEIRVSKMSDWRYECLVAFHELCEVLICKQTGVTTQMVDDFDIQYEKDRALGKYTSEQEPGDDPSCPCRVAHFIATNCERVLSVALGVLWHEYEKEVVSL